MKLELTFRRYIPTRKLNLAFFLFFGKKLNNKKDIMWTVQVKIIFVKPVHVTKVENQKPTIK